jgi:hypothetical protein
MKKKVELSRKLHDDPKIPTARRDPQSISCWSASIFFFANMILTLRETMNSTKHFKKTKITKRSLRGPSSSTSRPCRQRATAAAPPGIGLTLLVADRKSPNGSRRPHPSRRQNEGWTVEEAPWRSKDPHI